MLKGIIVFAGTIFVCASFAVGLKAQTFILSDDTTIEGTITKATNNTVIIMDKSGMILPLSLTDIQEVRIPASRSDETLSGRLISWENGVFELRTSKYVLRIAEGKILSATDVGSGVGGPVTKEAQPVPQPEPENAPAPEDVSPASKVIRHATM